MRLIDAAWHRRAAWRAPAHLALVTIALQGAPIISQALASLVVSLAIMGAIRTMESALPVVVLVASLGASSLAVREVAAAPDDDSRRTISRDLMLLPLMGTIVVLVGGAGILAIANGHTRAVVASALLLLPLALLININRCVGGIAQGWGKTERISVPVAAGSAIAIVCHVAGAWVADVRGWIAGRYVAEVVVLACVASVSTRDMLRWGVAPIDWTRFRLLARGAVVLNLAFVLRASADALPLLSLAGGSAPATELGAFGIATLVLTMVNLPIAVLSQFTLPALSRAAARQEASARTAVLALVALGALGSVIVGGGALLIGHYVPAKFERVAYFVSLLSLAVPLRAGATAYGTRLIAARRFDAPLIANGIEVAALSLLFVVGPSPVRCLIAMIGGAALSFGCLALLDHRPMRQA